MPVKSVSEARLSLFDRTLRKKVQVEITESFHIIALFWRPYRWGLFLVCKISKTDGTVSHYPWRNGSNAERGSRLFIACSAAMRFSVAGWVENRSEIPVGTM